MNGIVHWNKRFDQLIPLMRIDPTLPVWDDTIAATNIDPDWIITHWPAS